MSKDFRVAVSFFTHKKTIRLIRKLRLEGPWYLLKLWAWAREHCPDGNLEDMTKQDIEEAIGWTGESGAFMEAITAEDTLHVVRIDDNYVLHNWEKHNSWAAGAAKRSEIARENAKKGWDKRRDKKGESCGSDASGIKPPHAPSPSPSPSPTDKTDKALTLFDEFWKIYPKRNGKKKEKGVTMGKFKKFKPEEQERILKAATNYAASSDAAEGFAVDPKRFLAADRWKDWIEPEEKPQHQQSSGPSEVERTRLKVDLRNAIEWRDKWQENLDFAKEGTDKHKEAKNALRHYSAEVVKYEDALGITEK